MAARKSAAQAVWVVRYANGPVTGSRRIQANTLQMRLKDWGTQYLLLDARGRIVWSSDSDNVWEVWKDGCIVEAAKSPLEVLSGSPQLSKSSTK